MRKNAGNMASNQTKEMKLGSIVWSVHFTYRESHSGFSLDISAAFIGLLLSKWDTCILRKKSKWFCFSSLAI